MSRKKISLIILAVTLPLAVIGIIQWEHNFDPFEDERYSGNVSTATEDNLASIESLGYEIYPFSGSYAYKSFPNIVRDSDIIVIGEIIDIQYTTNHLVYSDAITLHQIQVEEYLKGDNTDDTIVFVTDGGFNGDFFEMSLDMFTFEEGDKVFLTLLNSGYITDGQIEYNTWGGSDSTFLITDNGTTEPQVHQYGKETSIPLFEFKEIIKRLALEF